jgi:hypothetical protein
MFGFVIFGDQCSQLLEMGINRTWLGYTIMHGSPRNNSNNSNCEETSDNKRYDKACLLCYEIGRLHIDRPK